MVDEVRLVVVLVPDTLLLASEDVDDVKDEVPLVRDVAALVSELDS